MSNHPPGPCEQVGGPPTPAPVPFMLFTDQLEQHFVLTSPDSAQHLAILKACFHQCPSALPVPALLASATAHPARALPLLPAVCSSMRLAGLATALLALAAVVAAQSDPCTLTSAADKTALLCAGAVGSVKTPNGTLSLKDAVKSAASAPLLELTFSGIAFTGSAFAEAAQVRDVACVTSAVSRQE